MLSIMWWRLHATASADLWNCVLPSPTAAPVPEISRQTPDAVVLDLMMPEFDGFAVLDALRQLPAGREILSKGGGEFALMLDSLRRWRPPTLSLSGEIP